MRDIPRTLPRLLAQAAFGKLETSIEELFEVFKLDRNLPLLQKLQLLTSQMQEFDLVLSPPISEGTFETKRCLSLRKHTISSETFMNEVQAAESSRLELKSSLYFDYQKHQANPHLKLAECRSEAVIHSTLKTIAAFLNTQGGILYIGVSDDRVVLGLAPDNRCLGVTSETDLDIWQLSLQELIRTRFKDGGGIGPYIEVSIVAHSGTSIARVQVASKSKLSFLKSKENKDSWHLYRRDGNRTLEVTIDEVEDYLSARDPGV
jgi:hypothetical protein